MGLAMPFDGLLRRLYASLAMQAQLITYELRHPRRALEPGLT